jgi:hypothetical protein
MASQRVLALGAFCSAKPLNKPNFFDDKRDALVLNNFLKSPEIGTDLSKNL